MGYQNAGKTTLVEKVISRLAQRGVRVCSIKHHGHKGFDIDQPGAVAFVGYQNAGKTTLVEKVISRLAQRGVRVCSIKHHGHKGFDIDQPGKDSWRHAQAGSRHVGLISPDLYAEYARTTEEVPVLAMLTRIPGAMRRRAAAMWA